MTDFVCSMSVTLSVPLGLFSLFFRTPAHYFFSLVLFISRFHSFCFSFSLSFYMRECVFFFSSGHSFWLFNVSQKQFIQKCFVCDFRSGNRIEYTTHLFYNRDYYYIAYMGYIPFMCSLLFFFHSHFVQSNCFIESSHALYSWCKPPVSGYMIWMHAAL